MSVILDPKEIGDLKTEIIFDGGRVELKTVKYNEGPITVRYNSLNGSVSIDQIGDNLPKTFVYNGEIYGRSCMGSYNGETNGIVAKYNPKHLWCKGASEAPITDTKPPISTEDLEALGFKKR